jgi:hypothetical protein
MDLTVQQVDAGTITGVTMFGLQAGTGPGLGTVAVPGIVTVDVNNDNQTGGGANDNNITVPVKRFDSPGYIDIEFLVTPSSGVTEYRVDEFVDNNTGSNWVNYRLVLGFGVGPAFVQSGAGDGLDFDDNTFDPAPTAGSFTNVTLGEDVLTFFGGVHGTGAQPYDVRIDVPDVSQGAFTLRQVPIVPEPATILLTALAAVGCVIGIRR